MGRRVRHLAYSSKALGASLSLFSPAIRGYSDGDLMGSWNDITGNGNDVSQTDPTYQPAYKTGAINGMPAARFTTSIKALTTAIAIDLPQPSTYIVSSRQLSLPQPSATGRIMDSYPPGANFAAFNNSLNLYAGTGVSGSSNLGVTAFIASGLLNGSSTSLWLNGISNGSGNAGSSSGSGIMAIGANAAINPVVGYYDGDIYATLLIPLLLSSSRRRRIEQSLGFTFRIAQG